MQYNTIEYNTVQYNTIINNIEEPMNWNVNDTKAQIREERAMELIVADVYSSVTQMTKYIKCLEANIHLYNRNNNLMKCNLNFSILLTYSLAY